ncbi:hypothetical protein GLOTRDRAFT_103597 [Gloeophyllum trabeum ATCC 11539]|uniref:BZIP domain-containing protein n=1 Tax=Gloeophyllum trabeum (strain ATCC 11539 / FP-39264 / Madison 617) TaxID=670483 RepID=S7QKW7_GLOTA|nr:uncharacterized protein GLOTRDRAFT_103597 [Gloeophyllum trabeum ATCC 11539]EPQ59928.1 hypothetical protein GLOTRDRAFT_103597 [Gloeophyllum trabeum ATCC 11539]
MDNLDGASNQGSKPGRKKNPNSQAARRDQNRIAQREFRLRKQQRIRDLEARVEILSGGKDEALSEMREILKDLMHENQVLRNLLKNLSSFIGEGAGGLLPKLGWDLADFNNFINKAETDTAWESHQRRKKARQEFDPLSSHPNLTAQKRPIEEEDNQSAAKRSKSAADDRENDRNGYAMLNSITAGISPLPASYAAESRPSADTSFFSELIRGTGRSPMFASQTTTPSNNTPSQYPTASTSTIPTASSSFQNPYLPPINMNMDATLPSLQFMANPAVPPQQQNVRAGHTPDEDAADDDPKRNEAHKLIHYHLDNFKRNSAYCLPSSLRPTLVQKYVPQSAIDRIPHPELRDRMILLRGRYDLVDCLHEYRAAVTIHGDDVLAHTNWEIGENWLRRYGYLVDQATLNVCNRWRRDRGEHELRLADLGPADQQSGSV